MTSGKIPDERPAMLKRPLSRRPFHFPIGVIGPVAAIVIGSTYTVNPLNRNGRP